MTRSAVSGESGSAAKQQVLSIIPKIQEILDGSQIEMSVSVRFRSGIFGITSVGGPL